MKNSINTPANKLRLIFFICLVFASSLCLANDGTKPKSTIPNFGKFENVHIEMVKFKAVNQRQNAIITYELKNNVALTIFTKSKAKEVLKKNGFLFGDSVLIVVKYQGKTLYKI